MLKVQYLGAVGGKDVADTTRRILRCLMTNGVARRMNFAGRGQKHGISELKILDVVIGKELLYFAQAVVALSTILQPLGNLRFAAYHSKEKE